MNRSISILAAVGLLIGVSFAIPALSATTASTISGCVNKKDGSLRIARTCTSKEVKISWNARGAQGRTGATGPAGAKGPTGPTGPTGPAGISFASNCYQHLLQAEASGYLWSIPSDVSSFESMTGCSVREIDLNPNSQIPGFYPDFAPQVLRAELLGVHEYGGEGDPSEPAFVVEASSIYSVTLTKPTGMEVCSLRPSSRVFESPDNGTTYVLGRTAGSQRGVKTDLAIGWGPVANDIQATTNRDAVVNGVTTTWYSKSQGSLEVQFEDFPTSMPLGSTYEIKIKRVLVGSQEVALEDLDIAVDGGLLAGLTREDDEPGFAAIYSLRTNELERGVSEISFSFSHPLSNEYYGYLDLKTLMGVSFCYGPSSELNLDEQFTNLYRINETSALSELSREIEDGFFDSVGWTGFFGWFD